MQRNSMVIERVDRNHEIYLLCSSKLYVDVCSSPAKARRPVPTFLTMRSQGLSRAYLRDVLDQIAALRIFAWLALGLLLLPPLAKRIRGLASVPQASHGTGRKQTGSDHQSQLTDSKQMSLYRFSLSLPISMRR